MIQLNRVLTTNILFSIFLAACGGGGGSGNSPEEVHVCTKTIRNYAPPPEPLHPFPYVVTTQTINVNCATGEPLGSASDVDSSFEDNSASSSPADWQSTTEEESEPNNQPEEADLFSIGPRQGYLFKGSLNDQSDLVDYLRFDLEEYGGTYHIYLCRSQDHCTEQRDQSGLYLVLYDQNLVVLDSTKLNIEGQKHWIDAPVLTTGLRYYIGVHATDTSSIDELYEVVITD